MGGTKSHKCAWERITTQTNVYWRKQTSEKCMGGGLNTNKCVWERTDFRKVYGRGSQHKQMCRGENKPQKSVWERGPLQFPHKEMCTRENKLQNL